jgi:transposase-like protein
MQCPGCDSLHIKKNGKDYLNEDRQRYKCLDCDRQWGENPKPPGRPPSSVGLCPECKSDRTRHNRAGRGRCGECGKTWKLLEKNDEK